MPGKANNYNNLLTFLIAAVWLVNGLICKVLNLVPRHELIVGHILGPTYQRELTILIGVLEIGMSLWIVSRYKPTLNAIVQILLIATMNVLEFFMVPHLLLWGRFNAVFAISFIGIILFHHFKNKSLNYISNNP
jgi:hypothetical protein